MANLIVNFIRRIFGDLRNVAAQQPQHWSEAAPDATEFNADDFLKHPGPVVYLERHGSRPEYKIGCTKDINARRKQVGILLPDPLVPIHCIYTNDPEWLEAIWHKRFAHRRRKGSGFRKPSEWFDLTDSDVDEFKQHKQRWNNPDIISPPQLRLPLGEPEETHNLQADDLRPSRMAAASQPEAATPFPSSSLHSRTKAAAVGRVASYFDKKIAAHPDRAARLIGARNWELAEIEDQMRQWQARGYNEAQALEKWEQYAYKSADAKLK